METVSLACGKGSRWSKEESGQSIRNWLIIRGSKRSQSGGTFPAWKKKGAEAGGWKKGER